MPMQRLRTYTELSRIDDFTERYRYLRLHSSVGVSNFGSDRYLNQLFYTSSEWRRVRNEVIIRDRGCDLGVDGYEVYDRIAIHHMNPMTVEDVVHGSDAILNPEYLVMVSHRTHNAIHFGDEKLLRRPLVVRRPGDTKLWLGVLMVATSTMISPNRRSGRRGAIVFIGIHTMEAPEGPSTAENVAAYFAKSATQASSHWCVDNNSRVRCVNDGDEAWTMPPVNPNSLNIELAGYASQGAAGWNDAYSRALLDNAAVCAAEWCRKYSIPLRRLSSSQIGAYAKGFVGHRDVNAVFHVSDHSDPGVSFPWDTFLKMVGVRLGTAPVSPPSPGPKPNCTAFQRAVHTTADNQWGSETDKCGEALRAATPYGGRRYPYGVQFAQKVVGTTQDGSWGPLSNTALTNTVVAVQKALLGMGFDPKGADGVWGANTEAAYNSARAACRL